MSDTQKPDESGATAGGYVNFDKQHLYGLLDNLLEGFQIISPDFRYIYVNETVAKQGKNAKEELIGRTMMEVYPGIDKTPMFTHLKRCMNDRVWHQMENEFTFPDGSTGWFLLRMEPVPEGIFILSLDITEQKRAEETRRQTEVAKAKEDFLFRTLHDLKSPTTVIGTILEEYNDSGIAQKYPDLKEHYELINAANERMRKLINYLFQYARGEKQEITLKKEPLDAVKIIQESIRELRPVIDKQKISASVKGAGSLMVLGDDDALREVTNNLLDNAIKYNKEGGTISVTATAGDKVATISVEDSGIGIPEEELPKLFSPYHRAFSGAHISGSGLGLFIVKGLIEKMDGRIDVASKLGEGTTFTVTMPLSG